MKFNFSEIWTDIEQDAIRNPGPHYPVRRIIPESSLDAFIGVDVPDNRRIFALEVNLDALSSVTDLPAFKVIEITKRDSVTSQSDKAALLITLKVPRFSDVFSVLIEDIATELSTKTDESEALSIAVSRLIEWQQLIESGGHDGLSNEAARGLYGELYLLQTHLIVNFGSKAIFGWKGYSASQQDYYYSGDAVEVKTTKAKQHQKLTVASERQLDESTLGRLFVYHLSVDEHPGNDNTLPSIIEKLRKEIATDGEAKAYFEDALLQLGYLDAQVKLYDQTSYEIREENLFAVTGEFPRIVEKDLRQGVGDVSYSVNVAECKHFSVDFSELNSLRLESSHE